MSIAYYCVEMSPAPARTSTDAIVAAARRILEAGGLASVTMRSVAEAVGVKGPSLYKRVPDRAALLRAVAESVVADLTQDDGPRDRDRRSARRPARRRRRVPGVRPAAIRTATGCSSRTSPRRTRTRRPWPPLGEPVVDAMTRLAGPSDALEGARTFVAWAHGFVSMELAGAFRLGGDLDAAYAFGIESILDGVSGSATPASG